MEVQTRMLMDKYNLSNMLDLKLRNRPERVPTQPHCKCRFAKRRGPRRPGSAGHPGPRGDPCEIGMSMANRAHRNTPNTVIVGNMQSRQSLNPRLWKKQK
jgi:hypothetical protein